MCVCADARFPASRVSTDGKFSSASLCAIRYAIGKRTCTEHIARSRGQYCRNEMVKRNATQRTDWHRSNSDTRAKLGETHFARSALFSFCLWISCHRSPPPDNFRISRSRSATLYTCAPTLDPRCALEYRHSYPRYTYVDDDGGGGEDAMYVRVCMYVPTYRYLTCTRTYTSARTRSKLRKAKLRTGKRWPVTSWALYHPHTHISTYPRIHLSSNHSQDHFSTQYPCAPSSHCADCIDFSSAKTFRKYTSTTF